VGGVGGGGGGVAIPWFDVYTKQHKYDKLYAFNIYVYF
jgi:hypothetical protein